MVRPFAFSSRVQDRYFRLRKFKRCFIGSELVDWLILSEKFKTREECIEFGQMLWTFEIIRHVADQHEFKDDFHFYRFDVSQCCCGVPASICGSEDASITHRNLYLTPKRKKERWIFAAKTSLSRTQISTRWHLHFKAH